MLAGSLNLMFSLSWLTKNVWPTAATVAGVMHINWEDRKRELIWLKSTIYGLLLKISHTITLKFPICFCFHYKTPKEWVVNYYTKLICILNHGSHSWIKETGWFLWPLDPEFIVYPLTFVALELTLTFNLTNVSGICDLYWQVCCIHFLKLPVGRIATQVKHHNWSLEQHAVKPYSNLKCPRNCWKINLFILDLILFGMKLLSYAPYEHAH